MPGEVDKSLLDRLAALRGSPGAPSERTPPPISVDTIQRAKTPTREDALAARLRSLRQADSPSSTRATPGSTPPRVNLTRRDTPTKGQEEEDDDNVDAIFATSDDVLEALLGDGDAASPSPTKKQLPPDGGDDNADDAKVKALLEELSRSIPQDSEESEEKEKDDESDDSDGEKMTTEADAVIARLRDEMEVEAALAKTPEDKDEEQGQPTFSDASLTLPSVPQDLATTTITGSPNSPPSSSNIDDITARLSALRASSEPPASDLPSVPTSLPVKDNPNRLKTTTRYTDEDMDSWCTVCSDDATLRCLGCVEDDKPDGDPYCARCWREMHLGPAAAFDDRSHRAVQFSRKQGKEKKIALGAS